MMITRMEQIINKFKVFNDLNEEIKRDIKLFCCLRYSYEEINVILVTNEDKVHCLGRNKNGVLGLGHNNSIEEFTINEELSNKRIIDFKNSWCHTIARTNDGKLYCWGENECLGNGRKSGKTYKPELNENENLIDENIIDMYCGKSHTLVLTSRNDVFAWGKNHFGQIGNGCDDGVVLIPFKVNGFNGEEVKAISCGLDHSLALTQSGSVYSWGDNQWGQLGINGKKLYESKPKRIQTLGIERISCGFCHSLLLSRDGHIYVFGGENSEKLGLNSNGAKQLTPKKLNHSEKFIEIATRYDHHMSAALTENGLYYIWGDCGEEENISPKETQYKSFLEIFVNYNGITFKTINRLEECLKNLFVLQNQKYDRNFCEIKPISSGSFGIVFKVTDPLNSSKNFAVKKIPISDNQKDKLSKESKIIAKMNNNYVVECFDFWIEENYYLSDVSNSSRNAVSDSKSSNLGSIIFDPYKPLLLHIQMECCYKTLREIIEIIKKELNQKETEVMSHLDYYISSELFKEIVECLNYLHELNPPIIHRDLKPANILISYGSDGRFVKLADFGLAVIHETEDQSHTQGSGTDKYMAPEVRETRFYDTKADIYSLGVITRELFSINKFSGNLSLKSKEIIDGLITEMTTLLPELRPTCHQILNKREIWEMNVKQLKKRKFKRKVNSIEDSFHLYLIQTKLEKYKKLNSSSDKCIII